MKCLLSTQQVEYILHHGDIIERLKWSAFAEYVA